MAGMSTTGDVVKTGKMMMRQASGSRRGPSNKNLGPSRVSRPNPAGMVRSMSKNLKGPDKGAGGR